MEKLVAYSRKPAHTIEARYLNQFQPKLSGVCCLSRPQAVVGIHLN
jgi:hypothetical protein